MNWNTNHLLDGAEDEIDMAREALFSGGGLDVEVHLDSAINMLIELLNDVRRGRVQ